MPVEMSSKPNRVRIFLAPNGQIYEGGPEQYYTGVANVVGGTPNADRLPREGEAKEGDKK